MCAFFWKNIQDIYKKNDTLCCIGIACIWKWCECEQNVVCSFYTQNPMISYLPDVISLPLISLVKMHILWIWAIDLITNSFIKFTLLNVSDQFWCCMRKWGLKFDRALIFFYKPIILPEPYEKWSKSWMQNSIVKSYSEWSDCICSDNHINNRQ